MKRKNWPYTFTFTEIPQLDFKQKYYLYKLATEKNILFYKSQLKI